MAVEENSSDQKHKINEGHFEHRKNSTSEPNLATADKYGRFGFPPGTTVDELHLYRRKRPTEASWAQDSLMPLEGSFKLLKTEYKRRFKNFHDHWGSCEELKPRKEDFSPVRATKPEDTWSVEGALDFHPEYAESFIEYPVQRPWRPRPKNTFELIDTVNMDVEEVPGQNELDSSEIKSNVIKYPAIERRLPLRRCTNLKIEGDFYATTENAEKFIEYLLTRRPDLARKPTTLKLEGDMDIKTEMREKFVPLEYQARPPLCKKFTNLHLEGDLSTLTEKQDKFVPYEPQARPPLMKNATNLHVEGELEFIPEYRQKYVEYAAFERPKPALPVNHLKADGFYETAAAVSSPFEQQIHPNIPHLRGGGTTTTTTSTTAADDPSVASRRKSSAARTESAAQFVEKPPSKAEIKKASNNLLLEGRIEMNPEYKNAYIDFYRDGKVSPRAKSRRALQYNLKSEGKMEISPEYSCSYVNFPRERPLMKRPEDSLSTAGELETMTEKNAKFVHHPNIRRAEPMKRKTQLKLDGPFECQPEYRKAYIDYLMRERVERMARPLDNLGKPPKRLFEDENPEEKQTDMELAAASPKHESPRRLSEIEAAVFGPKLTVSGREKAASRGPSRSVSPRPPKTSPRPSRAPSRGRRAASRRGSTDTSPKKFGKPVKVANLACRGASPARPALVDVSRRNKWMRDSSESSSAFVVLDKEINNNYWNNQTKNNAIYKRDKPASAWYQS